MMKDQGMGMKSEKKTRKKAMKKRISILKRGDALPFLSVGRARVFDRRSDQCDKSDK